MYDYSACSCRMRIFKVQETDAEIIATNKDASKMFKVRSPPPPPRQRKSVRATPRHRKSNFL